MSGKTDISDEEKANRIAVGKKIRAFRKFKHINQKELAAALDIKQSYLSKIENGHNFPRIESLIRMANLYGLHTDAILLAPVRWFKNTYCNNITELEL